MKGARQDKSVKKTYTKPKLTNYGDLGTITKANGVGNYLDATYPAMTHRDDLGWTSG